MRITPIQRLTTAAVAAAAMLLAGCGGGSEPADDGTLTLEFPTWQAEDASFSPFWKEVIAEYEAEHPDVDINLYQIPFDSYVDQLTTRFAANDRPEIVHLPARNATEFASRGWLQPLDSRLEGTDVLETWSPLQDEMAYEDEMFGVLLLGYGYTLYYNEALLAAAGQEVPTTPEELLAAAEATTAGDVYGFGATTTQNPDNYTELASFVTGAGAALSGEDGNVTADSPEVVEALQTYRDVLAYAPAGLQSQQRNELFLNGKIAMLLDGPFFLPELDSAPETVRPALKVAAPPFSTVPGGVSNSLHVPAGLDPATEDAVWDFFELVTSEEWQARYTELTNVPAPREGSVTSEAIAETPELELFQQLSDDARSIYPTAPGQRQAFGEYSDVVSEAAIALLSTSDPTEEIAGRLQEQLSGVGS